MVEGKISAAKLTGKTFAIFAREKKLFFALIVFFGVISTGFTYPSIEGYQLLFEGLRNGIQSAPTAIPEASPIQDFLFLLIIPYMFLMYGVLVIWARASIGGSVVAIEGGIGALVKRTLWGIWRMICTAGWTFLIMLVWMVVAIVFSLILGAGFSSFLGGGGSGATSALLIILALVVYIPMLMSIMILMVLSGVSFYGEANDVRLPIHKSFRLMRGNLLRAGGMMTLLGFAYYVLYFGFFIALMAGFLSPSNPLYLFALFLLFCFASMFYLFWVSFGALYAVRLVPELEHKDFKRQLQDIF